MHPPARSRSALTVLLTLSVLACDGGEGEHEGGHGDHVEVHVGRVPPAPPKQHGPDSAKLRERAAKVLGVLPAEFPNPDNPLNEAKIDLGRMLYYDTRLSINDQISCNSCHMLDSYGVDNLATSPGHDGTLGERNSPTVYNAGGHLAQFWDGREPNLEAQAKGPIGNPIEMGMPDEDTVLAKLRTMPGYVEAFDEAFPDGEDALTFDNIANAIAAFERRLTTPAPIDAWLGGDDAALSDEALAGLQLFLDTDCQSCHNGFNFGGASYQKLGTEKPWPGLRDAGRFEVTHDERDRFVFKVPTLRNVTETGPYLHNGSIQDLSEMVAKMVEHQTKRAGPFTDEEMANMLAFLDSLTGELPRDYIAKPELPEAGEPAPDDDAPSEPTEDGPAAADDAPPKPEAPASPQD